MSIQQLGQIGLQRMVMVAPKKMRSSDHDFGLRGVEEQPPWGRLMGQSHQRLTHLGCKCNSGTRNDVRAYDAQHGRLKAARRNSDG